MQNGDKLLHAKCNSSMPSCRFIGIYDSGLRTHLILPLFALSFVLLAATLHDEAAQNQRRPVCRLLDFRLCIVTASVSYLSVSEFRSPGLLMVVLRLRRFNIVVAPGLLRRP